MRRSNLLAGITLLLAASHAGADESAWDVAASLDLEARYFTQDARWADQDTSVGQFALSGTAEFRWRNDAGDERASFIPYARWDSADSERSLIDLQEAYWAKEVGSTEILLGVNTLFWGVTESVHLVDIINQTDSVADVDGEAKLGQPMLNIASQRDWGLVSLYVLPYFRERTFAGSDGRLRTPLPVATDAAVFESGAENGHVDLALRYSHYVGSVDIGLSLFSGTSREPRLLPDASGQSLVPHYDQIDQFGLDLQYTGDAWLWKLEAILRNGYADTFAAAVGGFEYTFYQLGESAADLGVLLEVQFDDRDAREPVSFADNDVFAGARLALNDTQDTAVLAGVGYDVDTGETFINVEADRRFGDSTVIELRTRLFSGANRFDPGYTIANDDYVELTLSRYF